MIYLKFGRYIVDILTRMKNGDKDYRAMVSSHFRPYFMIR